MIWVKPIFSGMKPSEDAEFGFFYTLLNRTENLNLDSNSLRFPDWKHLILNKKQGTENNWLKLFTIDIPDIPERKVATALNIGQGLKTTVLWPMCYESAECEPSILCAEVRVNTGV